MFAYELNFPKSVLTYGILSTSVPPSSDLERLPVLLNLFCSMPINPLIGVFLIIGDQARLFSSQQAALSRNNSELALALYRSRVLTFWCVGSQSADFMNHSLPNKFRQQNRLCACKVSRNGHLVLRNSGTQLCGFSHVLVPFICTQFHRYL